MATETSPFLNYYGSTSSLLELTYAKFVIKYNLEGWVPYFYLDSTFNTTIGLGHLVKDEGAALDLLKGSKYKDPQRLVLACRLYWLDFESGKETLLQSSNSSDLKKIKDQFDIIDDPAKPIRYKNSHLPKGANKQTNPIGYQDYENRTQIRLDPEDACNLLLPCDIQRSVNCCVSAFPRFFDKDFPFDAQIGILDMMFNMGPTKFSPSQWPTFFKAVNAKKPDWATAAENCDRFNIQDERNDAVYDCFVRAANSPVNDFWKNLQSFTPYQIFMQADKKTQHTHKHTHKSPPRSSKHQADLPAQGSTNTHRTDPRQPNAPVPSASHKSKALPTTAKSRTQLKIDGCSSLFHLINAYGHEGLSEIFEFNITASCADYLQDQDLLNHVATLLIKNGLGTTQQYFSGIISSFSVTDSEDTYLYHLKAVPAIWKLSLQSDCRVFHNQSVTDITQQILSQNYMTYDMSGLKHSAYPRRDFCVQYRESTLNFLMRLWEDEGIFFFFKHAYEKNILVLGDSTQTYQKFTDNNLSYDHTGQQDGAHITSFSTEAEFFSGEFVQTDYNFATSLTDLLTKAITTLVQPGAALFSIFDFPGDYATVTEGQRLSAIRLASEESAHKYYEATSNVYRLLPGYLFNLSGAPDNNYNKAFVVRTVLHEIRADGLYSNNITCLPAAQIFRPLCLTPRPRISACQTAIVVGNPLGNNGEINTSTYATVLVRFQWDHNYQYACPVRVAQPQAGNQWGTLFLPRIGDEVLINFIEGNPDKPLIIGSVYNSNNLQPVNLPFEDTISGIKTHSIKGGADTGNVLWFKDDAGAEQIKITAQKDFIQTITHNSQLTIKAGSQTTTITAGNYKITAKDAIQLTVGSNNILINQHGVYFNGTLANINN